MKKPPQVAADAVSWTLLPLSIRVNVNDCAPIDARSGGPSALEPFPSEGEQLYQAEGGSEAKLSAEWPFDESEKRAEFSHFRIPPPPREQNIGGAT